VIESLISILILDFASHCETTVPSLKYQQLHIYCNLVAATPVYKSTNNYLQKTTNEQRLTPKWARTLKPKSKRGFAATTRTERTVLPNDPLDGERLVGVTSPCRMNPSLAFLYCREKSQCPTNQNHALVCHEEPKAMISMFAWAWVHDGEEQRPCRMTVDPCFHDEAKACRTKASRGFLPCAAPNPMIWMAWPNRRGFHSCAKSQWAMKAWANRRDFRFRDDPRVTRVLAMTYPKANQCLMIACKIPCGRRQQDEKVLEVEVAATNL